MGQEFKTFMCISCGFEFSEEDGCPEAGLPPATRWADVPDDWFCPDCGNAKSDFEMLEE